MGGKKGGFRYSRQAPPAAARARGLTPRIGEKVKVEVGVGGGAAGGVEVEGEVAAVRSTSTATLFLISKLNPESVRPTPTLQNT